MPDMFTLKSVTYDEDKILRERGLEKGGEVQRFIDSEVLRLCDLYVPFADGDLIKSGLGETTIGSGQVKYRTLYARRWYYMPADFREAPRRGNYWFERMKQNGGKDEILTGAKKLAGAKST